MRPDATRAALAVALVAGLWSGMVHADWRRDYDRGMKAVQQQDWAGAEAAFRSALSEDPDANARKRFQGVVVKVYVPHYYAGLAAYRQGNCARALEYWNNAGSAAVVSGIADLASTQRSGVQDCTGKLASSSKPSAPVASPPPPPPVVKTTPPPPVRQPPPPAKPPVASPEKPVAAVSAPPSLVVAIGQFLTGDYVALDRFDPATMPDARSRAQALLLRAASRFTRAQLKDDGAALLDQARADVRSARAANAALSPDESAFSPRFRAFWRETR
jgi:hypothetical protein